ncbi:MAG: hypothetical protein A3G76_09275 [Acidobacteria bacterium RIFCSPLOWO2_12_FULL_65_11]|nr:MAG: hypothetical protein A3G76_09275 [Acidobacteria bacterium RIFCSPLOWO2_12_FULL_65_11]
MHDAGNGATMLGPDEQDVPAVALGDDLVLEVLRRLLAAQVRLERAAQSRALLAQSLANELQLRAGMIDDFAGGVDLVPCLRRLAPEGGRGPARRVEPRKRSGRPANRRSGVVDRVKEGGEREQLVRVERRALDGERAQNLRQFGRCAEREPRVLRQEPRCLGGVREQVGDLLRIDRGPKPRQTLGAHGRHGKTLDGLDDLIEFEGPEDAWLHHVNQVSEDGRAGEAGTSNTSPRIGIRDWGFGIRSLTEANLKPRIQNPYK